MDEKAVQIRIIEILANEIAQKSVQIAQLAAALEVAQKRIADLEAAQRGAEGNG